MGIKSVEMVRKIRDRNYEETKDMTTQEYLAYIQAKSAAFHSECKHAKRKIESQSKPALRFSARNKLHEREVDDSTAPS